MWDQYCGQVIRRVNRNTLIAIVLIAAAGGLFLSSQRNYLVQFFRGPGNADAASIVQHPKEDQFVRIHVDHAYNSGLQHEKTENGVTTIDSQYFVTAAAGKLLLLRIPNGGHPDEMTDFSFEGRVRPLSSDLSQHLVNHNSANVMSIATYYIDGQDFRDFGIGVLVFGIPILIFWLWLLWRYLRGAGDPTQHLFARRIAKYGQLEMSVHEIDAEMMAAHSSYSLRVNKVELTQNWLLTETPFAADAIRLNHLTWVHPFLLKRKMYAVITVSKYYFLDAYDDMGKKIHIKLTKDKVDAAIRDLAAKCPHVLFGFDPSLQKLWKRSRKDPAPFLQEVRARVERARRLPSPEVTPVLR
jgi:hypothetical protein